MALKILSNRGLVELPQRPDRYTEAEIAQIINIPKGSSLTYVQMLGGGRMYYTAQGDKYFRPYNPMATKYSFPEHERKLIFGNALFLTEEERPEWQQIHCEKF